MFHKRRRSDDITHILGSWEYDIRQEMMVRKIRGADSRMKIQMRLDLGLLQMEEEGRPDGKKPHGKESLLEYFESIVEKMKRKYGSTADFTLDKDDCYALHQEGIQYYYRYLCFFQLGDYVRAERDTARNLRLFDFVKHHAAEEKLTEEFEQYRPYVMMMNTRAKVLGALKTKNVNQAVDEINQGIDRLERAFDKNPEDGAPPRPEVAFLRNWADEIVKRHTPSKKQRLVEELRQAVEREEFEKAAKLRDRLNRMKDL
jgi:tetratricopeptide (TPR) repeat protein